jgi:1,2-diacylglycerol 3-beta-galactosyltransferase
VTKVLLLVSDTGGGHRAAANAIAAALREAEPGVETAIEDGLVRAAPFPFNHAPALYAWGMKRSRVLWWAGFHALNGPVRARLMADVGSPGMRARLARLIASFAPDVVVSTHPLLTRIVVRALRGSAPRPSFVVVVTDLVTGHASWYEPAADLICLPTPEALARAERCGVPRARMIVTGQPLHPRAAAAAAARAALRERFGWRDPVVLLVGGGDGVGDLGSRVRALAGAGIAARLVVVCGRNETLRRELAGETFPVPVDVRGFVDDLHELMAAADVLVTKGGPGSVMEGCLAGLPILIYDYLPGQEVGNVELVRRAGAGAYVPRTEGLVAEVRRLIADPGARATAAAKARALAVPDSAHRIAAAVLSRVRGRSAEEAGDPVRRDPVAKG